MSGISLQDFKGYFTKTLAEVYAERISPTSMLTSFFRRTESDAKEVSIEVQRGTELVAVDVTRGTEGNRNSADRSTEKIYVPPYYKEYFDATSLRHYKRVFVPENGIVNVSGATASQMIDEAARKYGLLQDKIERAYELQASQVFFDGVVQLKNGDNIDFKRKAGSLVDAGAGNYWDVSTVDPRTILRQAGEFLRTQGKAQGGVFNVIMGEDAFAAFLANGETKEGFDIRRIDIGTINPPQRNSVGGVFHGDISAGSYRFNIWTYPEYYERPKGTLNSYIPTNKIVVLPTNTVFTQAFAGVPQLMTDTQGNEMFVDMAGAFHLSNYVDKRRESHIFDIKSAGLMIPTAVDQIFTAQVLA